MCTLIYLRIILSNCYVFYPKPDKNCRMRTKIPISYQSHGDAVNHLHHSDCQRTSTFLFQIKLNDCICVLYYICIYHTFYHYIVLYGYKYTSHMH